MRYLAFFFILFSFTASAQIRDYQIKSDSPYDTLYVLTNDTATGSSTYKLGYWRNARDLFAGFGDRDWLRYRTDGIPSNTDTMYHDGIVTIGDDSTYTGMLNVIGRVDLRFPDTSSTNMMIGKSSGNDLVTGLNNFGFGAYTLKNLTTGNYNIAIGDSAIYTNTVSSQNVAIGVGSMKNGSAPRASVGVGYQTLYNMSSALGRNTAVGFQAGRGLTSGTYNVFMGYQSGLTTTGGSNTFIGGGSANGVTTGTQNVVIGALAAEALTTGSRNILIGYDVASSYSGSDRLFIDPSSTSSPLIYGDFDADSLLVNGKLGYTTTAGTATSISGRNGTQFTNVGTGWGIDLVSGNLVVDSSQVATQYDLTTISGGSNDHDWYEVGGTTPPDNIDDNMFSGTGNHGIGTTSPSKPLHVVGEARITGSGGTATTITGRDTDEDITDVTTGWGIDLTSGALVVDSSQVATQYDITTVLAGGMTNWYLAASGTGGTEEVNNGETVTITGAGINTATRSGGNVTITATEVDGSTTNEAWTADADDADTELITNQTVKFEGAGILTTDYVPASDKFILTATEVDGDVGNEIQTITVTGASAPYTLDLSLTSSDMIFDRSGIVTLTESPANTLIIGATEVDGSTSNELNTIEEGNATVQSSNTNIDFQSMFDVATDGAGEVNVSFDGGEATTVTTPETDDYLLMHDSGLGQNQKILWSDLTSDVLIFREDNTAEGTGNDIDFGTGIDLSVTGAQGDVSLDFNEFTTDAATEGDEYVILYDPSAVTQEKVLITSISGADGNGIFSASNDGGNVPTTFDVSLTNTLNFDAGTLYIDGSNNRIGVGTTSPDNTFNVEASGQIEVRARDLTGQSDVYMDGTVTNASTTNALRFYNKDTDIDISGDYYQMSNLTMTKRSATVAGGYLNFNIGYDSLLLDNVLVLGSRETGAADGYVNIAAGLRMKWTDESATSHTMTTGEYGLFMTNTAAKTVTLPTITTGGNEPNRGQVYKIYNDAVSGNITISASGGNTIVGPTTVAPGNWVTIEAAGSTKWISQLN